MNRVDFENDGCSVLSIHTLGELIFSLEDANTPEKIPPRIQALMVYLAIEARPLTRAHLCQLFWPDSPRVQARRNLRKLLLDAQRAMALYLLVDHDWVKLDPRCHIWVDATFLRDAYSRITRSGNDGGASSCSVEQLKELLSGYRGDFLASFKLPNSEKYSEWVRQQEAELYKMAYRLFTLLWHHLVEADQLSEAIEWGQRWVTHDTYNEEVHGYLMLALAHQDDIAQALNHYEDYARRIAKELEAEPSSHLIMLYEQLRVGFLPDFQPASPQFPRIEFVEQQSATEHEEGCSFEHIHPAFSTGDKQKDSTKRSFPAKLCTSSSSAMMEHDFPEDQYTDLKKTIPTTIPPHRTPMIGRESLVAEICYMLEDDAYRLVTLTGPGGIGKTYSAIAVVQRMVGRFQGGLHFIPLTGLHAGDNAEMLEQELAMATAAGMRLHLQEGRSLLEQIVDYLQPRKLLLVYDNFEHLVNGVHFLSYLLDAAPAMTILVTSRTRLRIKGEVAVDVPGLALPAAIDERNVGDGCTIEPSIRPVPAIDTDHDFPASLQLFLNSAHRQCRSFQLSETILIDIVRICHLVNGLPLAIEMAAARVAHFTVAEIADSLEKDLSLLSGTEHDLPVRHQSIEVVLVQSWALLNTTEQQALCTLAFFAGSFSRQAATAIAQTTWQLLEALTDKSLLLTHAPGRYELHSLMHRFILQKRAELTCPNMVQSAEIAHAYCQYYLRLLAEEAAQLKGTEATNALAILRLELPNIRHAWRCAQSGAFYPLLVDSLDALVACYLCLGFHDEAIACCQSIVDHAKLNRADRQIDEIDKGTSGNQAAFHRKTHMSQMNRAEDTSLNFARKLLMIATVNLAEISIKLTYYQDAIRHAEQALALAGEGRDLYLICRSKCTLGNAMIFTENHYVADTYLQTALQVATEYNFSDLQGRCYDSLAYLLAERESYQQAMAHSERAYAIYEQVGDLRGMAGVIDRMVPIEIDQEQFARAIEHLAIARTYQQRICDKMGEARTLNLLGCAHVGNLHYAESILAWQEAEKTTITAGNPRRLSSIWANLGWAYTQLGLYQQALPYLEKSLALYQKGDDPNDLYLTFCNLSAAKRLQGEHHKALALGEQGLVNAYKARHARALTTALCDVGLTHLALGNLSEAERILTQSLTAALQNKRTIYEIRARMGLAEVFLHQDQLNMAVKEVEALLPLLAASPVPLSIAEHFRPHWNCYQVLKAVDAPRAGMLLREAHDRLQTWAICITDKLLRTSYMHNVDAHQHILGEYAEVVMGAT